MSDQQSTEHQDAAKDAAQNVVDDVTSWEYSGEKDRIAGQLDEGLDEAGVDMPSSEKERVVEEIDDLKDDESGGSPDVERADPAE